ncbi:MAG: fimbrillin family protein [Bacteroidaceae bacterium]|nr:fimbrillin family protein [Bacteroidaceae bacterium]
MKKFYLFATAVTMLTACTNSEKITNDLSYDGPVMIGFETFHEKSTKAAATGEISNPSDFILDDSGNGGFGVWGFKGKPDDIPAATTAADYAIDVINTVKFVPIFDNVQVWYVSNNFTTTPTQGFTYAVPKYWDKNAEYIFFAYAPYDATNASLDKLTGKISIGNIPAIQDISASNSSSGEALVFGDDTDDGAPVVLRKDASGVIDYLMGTYVTEQHLVAPNKTTTATGTNQNKGNGENISYKGQEQTVGFTFGHMLSKLQVTLKAKEDYSGIKSIAVNKLYIKNMPYSSATTTTFTQTSPTAPAGTYDVNHRAYTSTLKIIDNGAANDVVATSKSSLYILKNGSITNGNVSAPTNQPQTFFYYIAPNDPVNNEGTTNDQYLLDIDYTITYVDTYKDGDNDVPVTENVSLSDVPLTYTEVVETQEVTKGLQKLEQNYSYTLTLNVGLNQIYFTVDKVENWTESDLGEVEIK